MKITFCGATALAAVLGLLQPALLGAAAAQTLPLVTTQPDAGADVAPYASGGNEHRWGGHDHDDDLVRQLREKVKYVFVIFNENHSFDNEYGLSLIHI